MMREENRSTRRKTLGIRLRSTETHPTYDPGPGLDPGHRGGRRDYQPLNHPNTPYFNAMAINYLILVIKPRKSKNRIYTLANECNARKNTLFCALK